MTLAEEIRKDWQRAYNALVAELRQKDHDLRDTQQKVVLLLEVLAQLRDTPNAVIDRVDRLLGRVSDE
jgi:uncharacterized protein YeeX (DUF496 family)